MLAGIEKLGGLAAKIKMSRMASIVLVGCSIPSLAACDRGGGSTSGSSGGGTTIIQTVVQTPDGRTGSAPSVAPISDPKKLCHTAVIRVKELVNATDSYWNLVTKDGSSLSDSSVIEAADHVTDVAQKDIPMLESMVGAEAPQNISSGIHGFVSAAKEFTQAIADRASNEEINPLAQKYKSGIDSFNQACYPGK